MLCWSSPRRGGALPIHLGSGIAGRGRLARLPAKRWNFGNGRYGYVALSRSAGNHHRLRNRRTGQGQGRPLDSILGN
jgi:hypothetical protein